MFVACAGICAGFEEDAECFETARGAGVVKGCITLIVSVVNIGSVCRVVEKIGDQLG